MSNKESVHHEYADGSYLEAVIENGRIKECPPIKIAPPAEWGGGAMTLDGALEFLTNIKQAVEITGPY